MPGIHTIETLTWHPPSTLSEAEGLHTILVTCKVQTKGTTTYYAVLAAVPEGGRAKLLVGSLYGKFADEVYEEVCSWAKMPEGYAGFSSKDVGSRVKQKPKEKPTLFRRR